MKRGLFVAFLGAILLNSTVFTQNVSDFSVDFNATGDGAVITGYKGTAIDVVVPSTIEGYPVTELADECFKGTKIISIKLSNGLTTIGEDCFLNCNSLKMINLPDTLTYLGASAFQGTSSLISITIPECVKTFGNDLSEFKNWTGLFGGSGVKKIVFSGFRETVSSSIFKNLEGIRSPYSGLLTSHGSCEEIVLPNGLKQIEDNSFYNLNKLMKINIPDSVTRIGANAFKNCTSITTIIIPNSVTEIGESAFENTGLTKIIIPNSVKEIGMKVFVDCKNMTSATLPDGLTEISRSLFNRTALKEINIPSTVAIIGVFAFRETPLEGISLPVSLKEIQGGAFWNCSELKNIAIPDSITTLTFGIIRGGLLDTVGTYFVFGNCDSLTLASRAKLKKAGYTE
jgi:hypothetical protein